MLLKSGVEALVPAKECLLPPYPCSIRIVGNGPSPMFAGGRVTSTSIGRPSKLGTRWSSLAVGQKRTPSLGSAQAWPNGSGTAAAGAAEKASTARGRARARARRRIRGGSFGREYGFYRFLTRVTTRRRGEA